LDLVGRLPDKEVAKTLGMTAENVRSWRTRRKIPALWRGEDGDGSTEQAPSLASTPAARTESGNNGVGSASRGAASLSVIGRFEHLLGIVPDATIAHLSGRRIRSVAAHRQRLGIPSGAGPEDGSPAPRHRKSKLNPYLHLLGKVRDAQIAEQAGVTEGNVANFRRRHRIPSARAVVQLIAHRHTAAPQIAPEESAPVVATEPESTSAPVSAAAPAAGDRVRQWAFAVTIVIDGEERPYTVLGADLAEAAAAAVEGLRTLRPRAVIKSMERLAEAL
jgi:hypothetical protein